MCDRLTYSPRPGPSGGRRPPVRTLVLWGALTALILTTLGGWVVATQTAPDRVGTTAEPAAGTAALSLPWPEEGQASVIDTGSGRSGTSGAQRPVPIASLAKVMTAHVILTGHRLGERESGPEVRVDRRAAEESFSSAESTVIVQEGQRFSQRQLLEMLLLPSGNNIARLLARWDAGSEAAFTAKMNRAATALGMTRTTYTGASGIEPTTTSTSDDQLRLARAVMKDPAFRAIVATRETTIGQGVGTITNTNKLLGTSGIVGVKTGSSTPAGGALMWAATAPRDPAATPRSPEAAPRSPEAAPRDPAAAPRDPAGLILGVVLHQDPGTTPAQGLRTAFDVTERLAAAAQRGAGR
ncbi:D-alanyl-D-alanine carboxypeptidase [Streptomyces sp. NPDC004610]|uniref:D-alanyl-D-alanine carboxypeptidase family protein n=1 Tax=unclassified Streptomyces TaxID=2593676 RepID=UPI0033A7DC81